MLELGRSNACIVDGAAAFDDSSKFDDDGKIRRTGLNLSSLRRLPSYLKITHFSCFIVSLGCAETEWQSWSKSQ